VAGLTADEDPSHRAHGADAQAGIAALDLGAGRVGQIGAMPLAAASSARQGPIAALSSDTSLPSDSPKPPGSRKSRCISITTTAVRSGSIEIGSGSASTTSTSMVSPFEEDLTPWIISDAFRER
jgi:hypothetical protein